MNFKKQAMHHPSPIRTEVSLQDLEFLTACTAWYQHPISKTFQCLKLIISQKRIRQYFYADYYYSQDDDWDDLEMHAGKNNLYRIPMTGISHADTWLLFPDHCIESLRQTLMCSADVSLYTLEWTRHSRHSHKPSVRVPQAHACVDWSKLHEWMMDRAALFEKMVPPPGELFEGKAEP